jgi:aminopeptidase N
MLGPDRFRELIRTYVARFAHGVAAWPDLLALVPSDAVDPLGWSRVWIESAGRPTIVFGRLTASDLHWTGGTGSGADAHAQVTIDGAWRQQFEIHRIGIAAVAGAQAEAEGTDQPVVLPSGRRPPYGVCELDGHSRRYALTHAPTLPNPQLRGMLWVVLFEDVLDGRVAVGDYLGAVERAIRVESVEQILQVLSTQAARASWRFTSLADRRMRLAGLEQAWWEGVGCGGGSTRLATCFWAYQQVAVSDEGRERLARLALGAEIVEGLRLTDRDRTTIALGVAAASGAPEGLALLERVGRTVASPDEQKRAAFMRSAVSPIQADRDALFTQLFDPAARERESWAVEALSLLNHPIHAHSSSQYVEPGLVRLPELERTSDIFFPKRWCDALLHGHAGTEAADVVRRVLACGQLPERLRRTVLQSADDLFRAERLLGSGRRLPQRP